jgi:hypothetical protein
VTAAEVIAALDLPAGARVDRRVPKTLLLEHGAPTAADKRRINEGIEAVQWIATLKPTTVGVPAFRDTVREYLEIAVLRIELRAMAKMPRLLALVHRAIPYPVLAVTERGTSLNLSVAHKRWSQGDAGKTVLDGDVVVAEVKPVVAAITSPFIQHLSLIRQPQGSLWALYEGWTDLLFALEAARRTGTLIVLDSAERRNARRVALGECARLEAEVARIGKAAVKERQMARQVALNLELKRVEKAYANALILLQALRFAK